MRYIMNVLEVGTKEVTFHGFEELPDTFFFIKTTTGGFFSSVPSQAFASFECQKENGISYTKDLIDTLKAMGVSHTNCQPSEKDYIFSAAANSMFTLDELLDSYNQERKNV